MTSLQELRLLNTRPPAQARKLSQQLIAAGIQVIELPLLETMPIFNDCKSYNLIHFNHVIFVSPSAVEHFFEQCAPSQWPHSLHTIALGQGTAQAMTARNIPVNTLPHIFNSEGILALAALKDVKNQSILLIKGKGGLPHIEDGLTQRGANVHSLNVYQRVKAPISDKINRLYRDDAIDMILITSEEGLDSLFSQATHSQKQWLCGKTFLVLSSRIEKKAAQYGVKSIFVCEIHSLLNTLEAIYDNN